MTQSMVLQRGRRAGNVLLIKVIVCTAIAMYENLSVPHTEAFPQILMSYVISPLVLLALALLIVVPLRHDRIKNVRIVYFIIIFVYAYHIYKAAQEGTYQEIIAMALNSVLYVLALVGLYCLGEAGKVICFAASGLSLIYVIVLLTLPDISFSNIVTGVFFIIYFIFLGLYVESKASFPEKSTENKEPFRTENQEKYTELIRLKDLMDKGVITEAEYLEKKKQILGL